jgi:hypothetical protein
MPNENIMTESIAKSILEDVGIPKRENIDWLHNIYRFGLLDPYEEAQNGREYLFFVKPDLYIVDGSVATNGSCTLQSDISNNPFFLELARKWPQIIPQLQYQADSGHCPFSLLLTNAVASNLDLPGLQSTTIQNPVNNFGTSYDYRGTSEASDDNFTFSLEFKDTKYLDVYMFFRAYEEYETLKAQGRINLYKSNLYRNYTTGKILHDQFGIFKFIVGEDMETILHYSYYCGVMWTSLPRDSFNDANFDDGIKYAIDGKAAFVEDMNPLIIKDFNNLVATYASNSSFVEAPLWVPEILGDGTPNGHVDQKPVKIPYVDTGTDHGIATYKLKFKKAANRDN